MANKKCKKCGSQLVAREDGSWSCSQCAESSSRRRRSKSGKEKSDSVERNPAQSPSELLPPVAKASASHSPPQPPSTSSATPPVVAPPVVQPPVAAPPVVQSKVPEPPATGLNSPVATSDVSPSISAPPVANPLPAKQTNPANPSGDDFASDAESLLPPKTRKTDAGSTGSPTDSRRRRKQSNGDQAGQSKSAPRKDNKDRSNQDKAGHDQAEKDKTGEPLLPPKTTRTPASQSASRQTGKESTESLLPQKSSSTSQGPELLPESKRKSVDQELLPQAATKSSSAKEIDSADPTQKDAGEEFSPAPGEGQISESEKVLLPDGEGGFVEVSERKTTVDYRGAKIELSRLKREEKEASRNLTNFFVITFCVVLLISLMLFLNWYSGLD